MFRCGGNWWSARVALAAAMVAPGADRCLGQCEIDELVGSDTVAGDQFGGAVAIDRDVLVVGARDDDDAGPSSGSVYVFGRDPGGSGAWVEEAKLVAGDQAADDEFGIRVALDAGTLVVGAPGDDDNGSGAGLAYVFARDEGGPDAWGEVTKLLADDGAAGDNLGGAVAVHGDLAVVGARRADAPASASGAAYLFGRDAGGPGRWGLVTKLMQGGALGSDVGLDGDTLVAAAMRADRTRGVT